MVGVEHSLKTLLQFGIHSVLKILNKKITQGKGKGKSPGVTGLLKSVDLLMILLCALARLHYNLCLTALK